MGLKIMFHNLAAHIEALPYPMLFINRASKLGMKAGLSVNIKTDIAEIVPFIPIINHVLVMTAEPDENGELLYPSAVEKAKSIAKKHASQVEVYVDGGIDAETLKELSAAGIAGAILGRSVFHSGNPYDNLCALDEAINN
jgi:ribulose-phosphate 3-epimerase